MLIPFISQLANTEQEQWLKRFQLAMPQERFVLPAQMSDEQKRACQFAIVANPEPALMHAFENLVWVQSLWAGVEGLLNNLSDIPFDIARLIDPFLSETMAEAVLSWSLYLHRDMPRYTKQQQQKVWQQHDYIPASKRCVGILGLGELGTKSVQRLQQNGFNVCGWSRNEKHIDGVTTFNGEAGLHQMVTQTDILVSLVPLTDDTTSLINESLINLMPHGSSIINFSRGKVVNTQDLINALARKQLSHAVLDVFDQEPLHAESPLWHHPNITILPHISAPTNSETACSIVAENILHYKNTGQLPKCVDKHLGY